MDDGLVVVASGLVKRYQSVMALAGLDLGIRRGEIFGLIGPNGAGKTTLIRAIVGALQPTAGSVRVLGLDPIADRWQLRRRLGYMPQQPALYPDLTTHRNVAFFAAAHSVHANSGPVQRTLELVDLVDRADDPVRTLSGGMRQRVSLACALVHEPELLILDEPTAGVDPELRATFWQRFREMANRGTTVVVSTHQMGEALECDRVALIRAGKVVAAEGPGRLFRSRRATVRLDDGNGERRIDLDDYERQLPALMHESSAARVTIEMEPLDDIVLRLIREGEE